MKQKAIIVDLDGTLCDNSHRQHFMEQRPKDWKSFYAGISEDVPNEWCEWLLIQFEKSQHMKIILVSGRPKDYLQQTESWLKEYSVPYDELFMRESGDFREDFIVKKEIYNKYIQPHYRVLFTIDDRQQVVDMWRSLGITCLQCAKGDF